MFWIKNSMNSAIDTSPSPVFIVGVHRRCGSNFLADALQLHPMFQSPKPLSEDYLLHSANFVNQYIEETTEKWWKKRFEQDKQFQICKQSFYSRIGDAMLEMLLERIDNEGRLLTKTPDPDNLDLFFDLFPSAQLVLLIRDGRDVIESSYKSWPSKPRKHWMKMWARGAQIILDFMEGTGQKHADRWKLVRYEDFLDGDGAMRQLLDFLNVAPQSFPWEEFHNLPIRGSAVVRGGKPELHWEPVEKPKDFKPTGRWEHWGKWTRWQCERVAGKQLRALGY